MRRHGLERLWRGDLKRDIESLRIAAQNNAIRTIYIKPKTNNIQQNSKCRLHRERDEMANHKGSKCSKLEQKRVQD